MKIWKYLLRFMLIALAVGLILLILYGLWQAFRWYWYPILLWGYCSIAVGTFFLQVWFLSRTKRVDNPQGQELLVYHTIDATKVVDKLQLWRSRLSDFLVLSTSAIIWPITFLFAYLQTRKLSPEKRSNLVTFSAHERLYPVEAQSTIILLGVVLAVYASHLFFALPEAFGKTTFLLIAVYCTARLLYYTVSPISLAAQLRRSPRNSYVSFIIIAVSLYCVLVLSFAGYIHGVPNVSIGQLVDLTWDMLKFRKAYGLFYDAWHSPSSLLHGTSLSPMDYFVTIAGFLYYISLLRTIKQIKEFRRTDADYNAIAQSYLFLGKFNEALKLTEKVQAPDPMTYSLQASAYFGVNQLSKAVQAAKNAHLFSRKEEPDKLNSLYNVAAIAIFIPIPAPYILRVLEQWLELGAQDAAFIDLIDSLITQNRISAEDHRELLERTDAVSKRPLLYVHYLINTDNFEEAREKLKTLPPNDGINEVFRRTIALRAAILDPTTSKAQDAASFESWAEENLAVITRLVSELVDDQDKTLAVFQLNWILITAREIGSSREEEIQFLMGELRNSIKTEDLQRKSAAATAYIQSVFNS